MRVGFYGKLPSHGDFLRRRVSDAFVDAFDLWLRECLATSRTALGSRWLDVYLTSPAWRFVCAAGVCGPSPVIGLLAPSVDRAGRYFPLAVVAELPDDVRPIAAAAVSGRFFDSAERLVIETLAAERVDFHRFDRGVMALEEEMGALLTPGLVLDRAATAVLQESGVAWQVPIGAASHLASAFGQLLSFQLEALYDPLVVWWTDGSTAVEPSCLIARGLPSADQFTAFLDGSWNERQWQSVPVHIDDTATLTSLVVEEGPPLSFRSAAATDVGRARDNNEDCFIERPEAGVWAVADGMGGHSHGEVASRMVCDALIDFRVDGTFEDAVSAASARVQAVNAHLVRRSEGQTGTDRSGSTLVVLLARGNRSAILWAGDSRVYRWREGELTQLSRDHSLAEMTGSESSVITRAVGVQADLTLDAVHDGIRSADRFLLCTDGLTRVVADARICELVANPDLEEAVDGLIRTTLDAGGPDNVTVLLVEAYR